MYLSLAIEYNSALNTFSKASCWFNSWLTELCIYTRVKGMEYIVVECYCTCILREFKIFFHPAKFDNFKEEKISDFKTDSEKTCWTENWWSSGIMSNFWGEFFYVLGVKKNLRFFFKNFLATALKSYIKWLL